MFVLLFAFIVSANCSAEEPGNSLSALTQHRLELLDQGLPDDTTQASPLYEPITDSEEDPIPSPPSTTRSVVVCVVGGVVVGIVGSLTGGVGIGLVAGVLGGGGLGGLYHLRDQASYERRLRLYNGQEVEMSLISITV